MDQATLVEVKIAEGQRLAKLLVKDGFDVTAAFWLQTAPDDYWYLYVVSPGVDEKRFAAYGALHTIIRGTPDLGIDPARVKLIDAREPLARDVVAVRNEYQGNQVIAHRGRPLGGRSFEVVYIYPAVSPPG